MNIVLRLIKMKILPKLKRIIKIAFSAKYLLYTNVGISISLNAFGDGLEQSREIYKKELKEWDHVRTKHMAASGITSGVLIHSWYKYLDKRLPGNTIKIVTKKVVIDQIVFSPISIITLLATLAILKSISYSDFILECKQKAWQLYVADCAVRPPAQFINFYFLTTKYRVLYDSIISLGVDIYTSHVVNTIALKKAQDS